MLAGVAGGIALHLGISSSLVRVLLVASTLAGGFGLVVYVLTWLLAPLEEVGGSDAPPRRSALSPRRVLGIGLVIAGGAVLAGLSGLWFGGAQGWPVLLAAIGFTILWARRSDDGRTGPTARNPLGALVAGPVSLPRAVIGAVLVLGGLGGFMAANTSLAAAGNVLLAMVVAVGGAALLAGPWVWNMGRELMDERASRVRSEARAEMAAHLHDSVLQTLALVQRATAPREMVTLARTQERELRAWLYGQAPAQPGARLRDAIEADVARLERQYQVPIEAVVVGDADLDDRLRALVNACAEAITNAARHSGSQVIRVFVEVETDAVSAFVRDQGRGFDPVAVPSDRRGIADSIVGRIERRGGTVTIDSRPAAGTEVVIRLPRAAP